MNKNICVMSAHLDRVYVACQSPVAPLGTQCEVYCFQGDSAEPVACPEFEAIQGTMKQIAFGEKHKLVLTTDGTLYSSGGSFFGTNGHGGAKEVPDFAPIPALKDKRVEFVAAGGNYSIAVTEEGDVYGWGHAFFSETGQLTQVSAVPRFSSSVVHRVLEVSCGDRHVVALTNSQQCIAWGENSCGQLGVGQKSKPTCRPFLLEKLPLVKAVGAGWAHSLAVSVDGQVYSWGLNSHGQLGLGDTTTRLSPEHVRDISSEEVISAQGSRVRTVFYTTRHRAYCAGQVPRSVLAGSHTPPLRDPKDCFLTPTDLVLLAGPSGERCESMLSDLAVFDRGAIAFARSTVYRVSPNLAPVQGGGQVRVSVTGVPYEDPASVEDGQPPLQDTMPVKVFLFSENPSLEFIVPGRIVEQDVVEFEIPDIVDTPLGEIVSQGLTCPVQIRVSLDGGLTWTPDRQPMPTPDELEAASRLEIQQRIASKTSSRSLSHGLSGVEGRATPSKNKTLLWFCHWPESGPSGAEPACAPVEGGTDLLLRIALPSRMPTEALTVKFTATPIGAGDEAELKPIEARVKGKLDSESKGVHCVSPPFPPESASLYEFAIELSLDGQHFLSRPLPFQIYNTHVVELDPPSGPLLEPTQVKIRTEGFVRSRIYQARLDFPEYDWPSRVLPVSYDYTTGEISFEMPDLSAEVRQGQEEALAAHEAEKAAKAAAAEEHSAEGEAPVEPVASGAEKEEEEMQPDPAGGLEGLQVFVELSLNGQHFTEDRIAFTYTGLNHEPPPEEGSEHPPA